MKKVLFWIPSLVLIFSLLHFGCFNITARAATEGYYTYTLSEGKVTITDCDTSISGDITLPATLGGYPVTGIGDSAFSGCRSLTSVTIPDSITVIGESAFKSCSRLTSVAIPDGVTRIGANTFSNCYGLISVVIPEGVTSIGDSAFNGCSSLTGVTIPDSVTSIGTNAFWGCYSLISVTIPGSVTSIEFAAFSNCSGLTSLILSEGVTGIGDSAFSGCKSLISVTIPDGLTSIGKWAFYNCSGLTSVILSESAINIGFEAFDNCTKLTGNRYGGLKYLGTERNPYFALISYAERYSSYTIHPDTKVIAGAAFDNYIELTSVSIPKGLIVIGPAAFRDCSRLTSVTIPEGVMSIGGSAFQNCTSLTGMTIPGSVTAIESSAFYQCASLADVTIQEGVSSIGMSAFSYCTSLKSLTIPKGVTSIGNVAFSNCTSLTNLTIEEGITEIGYGVFQSCEVLTNVAIPKGVTSIGMSAFSDCYKLISVTIPEGVTSIGSDAFRSCYDLASVTIPDSVTNIGPSAFSGCSSLAFNRYHDLEYLGSEENPYFALISFVRSTTLSYAIHPHTEVIAGNAFSSCRNLTNVTIPKGVVGVGDYAFSGTGLKKIYFLGNAPIFGDSPYSGVTATAYYHEGTTGWDQISAESLGGEITLIEEPHTVITEESTATCTTAGVIGRRYCSVCNRVLAEQTLSDALGHSFTDYFSNWDATCLEDGTKTAQCDRCEVTDTLIDEGSALGHWEVGDCAIEATCTETGLTEGEHCERCGQVLIAQTVVDALGHTEVIDVGYAATCTESGWTDGKHCSVCYEVLVFQDFVDALGHTEVIDAAVSATCTATGLTQGKHCDVCGEVLVAQEVIPATGVHVFENGSCIYGCGEVQTKKVTGLYSDNVTTFSFDVHWDPMPGAVKYWVYINGFVYNSAKDKTSMSVLKRTANYQYTVSVIALMEDGTILPLAEADQILVQTEPYKFTFTRTTNSITLIWDVVGCTKSWIYMGTSEDNLTMYKSTAGSSYTVSGLEPNTVYYFQLSHMVNGSISTMNYVLALKTNELAPTVEGVKADAVTQNSFHVSWDALPKATKYWVYVDGALAGSSTGTGLTVIKRQPGTTYEVAVIAKLENGKMLLLENAKTITVTTNTAK